MILKSNKSEIKICLKFENDIYFIKNKINNENTINIYNNKITFNWLTYFENLAVIASASWQPSCQQWVATLRSQ